MFDELYIYTKMIRYFRQWNIYEVNFTTIITHIINIRNFSIGRFLKRLLTGFKRCPPLHS